MPAALPQGALLADQALVLGVWRGASSPEHQVEWHLKRNCALTPGQLARVYAGACVLSLGIAASFHAAGAALVLPFAIVELLALGAALIWYGRHAADQERISLRDERLCVEQYVGSRVQRMEFDARWVRVEPLHDDRSLVRLSSHGRSIDIGQHVRPGLRRQLAAEFRWALRQLSQGPAPKP